jgi:hypothetical protein
VYFQQKIYKDQSDFTYNVAFVYLTYCLEMTVGISTSCMPSLARLHKDKTGTKFNSIVSSIGYPFRSSRKSTASSRRAGSEDSSLATCPKKSPYSYMEDDSVLESQSHEMSCVESESFREEQHLDRSLPHGLSHFSVDFGQNAAADPDRERSNQAWPIRP